jgi:hypothetical protein
MPLTPISVAMISAPTVIPIMVFPAKTVRRDRRCFGDYRRCHHGTNPDEIRGIRVKLRCGATLTLRSPTLCMHVTEIKHTAAWRLSILDRGEQSAESV